MHLTWVLFFFFLHMLIKRKEKVSIKLSGLITFGNLITFGFKELPLN